jgi:hypothetical protein
MLCTKVHVPNVRDERGVAGEFGASFERGYADAVLEADDGGRDLGPE